MYLADDRSSGQSYLVFTEVDPREDGFTGTVLEDVFLSEPEDVFLWPDGSAGPEPCVGQDPANSKCFTVFKYPRDLQNARFRPVSAAFGVYERWSEYEKSCPTATPNSQGRVKAK